MTRKARRKRNQERRRHEQITRAARPPQRCSPSWMTMSAVVASTAFAAAQPTSASAGVIADVLRPRVPIQLSMARAADARHGNPAQEQPGRFDIPPGPLDVVLAAFEQLTGLRVTVSVDAIRSIQSPGVTGTLTTEEALQQMLAGNERGVSHDRAGRRHPGPADRQRIGRGHGPGAGGRRLVSEVHHAVRDVAQTIAVIPRTVMQPQGSRRSATRCATFPGSPCRRARVEARRILPATCSTCAASVPRTVCSSTGCATTGWCRETCSISSRSKCSWDRPAPTSVVERPPAT